MLERDESKLLQNNESATGYFFTHECKQLILVM